MKNTLKFATLAAAAALAAAPSALALDGKIVLDQMVKKGLLTPEEADAILTKDAKKQAEKPGPIEGKQADARKITLSGRVQVQGKFFSRDNHKAADTNEADSAGFEVRRMNLDFDAELVKGFTAFGSIEATSDGKGSGSQPNGNPTFIIDKAGVKMEDADVGIFTAALQKGRFGVEEYTSASNLYTIERSAVSNYFAGSAAGANNLGLGARHIGLSWENIDLKKIEKDGGFRVGATVANSNQNQFAGTSTGGGTNSPSTELYLPAFYANTDYGIKLNDKDTLVFSVNTAYTEANINQVTAGLPGNTSTNANFDTRTLGFEFVTKAKIGGLTLIGDFMGAYVDNGKVNKSSATDRVSTMPWGVTGTVAYKVTESLEPLVQLGYADSDGRGISDGTFRDFPNGGATYDRAITVFVGSSYYITPKTVKLTAGLDCARFEGRSNADAGVSRQMVDVIGGRVQIQALF